MNIWKIFYPWNIPNYNLTENTIVDQNLIDYEFKTIENVPYKNLFKYLTQYEISFFDKLAFENGFDQNYEIGFILYNLYKLLQHTDYFETFLVIAFKQRRTGNTIFSLVNRALDSKVVPPLPLTALNNKFIDLQKITNQPDENTITTETHFHYVSDKIPNWTEFKIINPEQYGLCILSKISNRTFTVSNKNITALSMVSVDLNKLPSEVYKMTNLEILNISQNYINEIKPEIKNLTKLKEFHAMQNDLATLPEQFGKLTQLNHCDLGHNKLISLPETFGNLSQLVWLNLFKNGLQQLPKSFENLQRLEQLALFRNKFKVFPNELQHFSFKMGQCFYYLFCITELRFTVFIV